MLQISELFPKFDELHFVHGSKIYKPIYGGGQINNPKICLIFMNPTAKNVSADANWSGIRAPWIGTKNVWKLFFDLGLFKNKSIIEKIIKMKPEDWDIAFAEDLYSEIANESIYITNIAKCTQDDARHLSDSVYKDYLPTMIKELEFIKPEYIFTLGNQVSSVLLQKQVSVSKYPNNEYEILVTPNNLELKVYPTYYPVGQGMRNMPKAIQRIKKVLT